MRQSGKVSNVSTGHFKHPPQTMVSSAPTFSNSMSHDLKVLKTSFNRPLYTQNHKPQCCTCMCTLFQITEEVEMIFLVHIHGSENIGFDFQV